MPSNARLRDALGRLWRSIWRRRPLVGLRSEHDENDRGWAAARGRFWTEFREGEREAEAHRSRPR